MSTAGPAPFTVVRDGVELRGEEAGEGAPVLLLHGLTATRRYVVHGSRMMERAGHRVVAYDARGHGESGPAGGPEAYTYDELVADAIAVLDDRGIDRAVVVGQSMGSATAVGLALRHPERVGDARRGDPRAPRRAQRRPRPLGPHGGGAGARRPRGLPRGARHLHHGRALPRRRADRDPPAARAPRPPGRRRAGPPGHPAHRRLRRPRRARRRSRRPPSSSAAATPPTPTTRSRSPRSTPAASPARGSWSRSPGSRRSPGGAARSPARSSP